MALEPVTEYGRHFRHEGLQTKAVSPTRNTRLGPNSRQRPRLWLVAFYQLLPPPPRQTEVGRIGRVLGATLAGRKQSLPEYRERTRESQALWRKQ